MDDIEVRTYMSTSTNSDLVSTASVRVVVVAAVDGEFARGVGTVNNTGAGRADAAVPPRVDDSGRVVDAGVSVCMSRCDISEDTCSGFAGVSRGGKLNNGTRKDCTGVGPGCVEGFPVQVPSDTKTDAGGNRS